MEPHAGIRASSRNACLLALAALGLATAARAEVSPQQIRAIWAKLPRPRVAAMATAKPPAIDGKIDAKEWAAASRVADFIGVETPRWKGVAGHDLVSAQTTVWVTYDAANLYVAFRCEEPEIETLVVKPQKVARDAALWWDDCVEIFIDPPGEGDYQIILNSKAAIFDAKYLPGGKSDRAWNVAGLNAAARVSPPGEDSHWTVEAAVPFAALGTKAPKPGEVWGINFGRERWAALYKAIAECSTWSGLVGSFQQPKMYGEICFTDVRQATRLPRPFLGATQLAGEFTSGTPREVKLEVQTASAARAAAPAGSATAALASGRPTAVKATAAITTEGTQFLALLVRDAESGDLLSCTRVPFHVPEVLTATERVRARIATLLGKAEKGGEFGKSCAEQLAELDAVTAEAKKLLPVLAKQAPDEAHRKQWQTLHDRVARIESATTFAVWTCSPYIATGPGTMPPRLGAPPRLVVRAAQNETEHAIVNVTNFTDAPIEFQLQGELPGQVGRPRSGLNTTAQKLVKFQPRLLGKKLSDVPEKEDGLAMPLVELNGLATFYVQPTSTRQLWLTVQTRGLKPGTKAHALRVVPLSVGLPAVGVPVEMTVWPFRIADEAPIGVFCFDYAGDCAWMKSYKINLWFRGAFPNKLALDAKGNLKPYKTDIDRVKQRMAEGARKFLFSYGYAGSFIDWAKKNKIEYMSDQWKRLFKEILARMVKEWLEAGLTYDDFALQSIDEAHGHQVQQVVETTPLIREVDPKVRTAMTIMTDLADLKTMAPHVDVWVNRNGAMWGKDQWDFFHAEQAKGKPIWSWNMPCTPKSAPLTQFRTYGWRAMKFDFDAIGFFLYFGLVYQPMRKGGGIATRHWEAWRDGVEDYQVLDALRGAIARARTRGVAAEKLEPSRELLARAIDKVVTEKFFPPNTQETHETIEGARAMVAGEIARVGRLR